MDREDAKDLTLSILVLAAAALVADCIWLHFKSARHEERIAVLSAQVERLLAPPPPPVKEPSFSDRAKETYEKVKNAAVKGYEAAKDELSK